MPTVTTRWSPAGIWEFSIIAEFEIIFQMKFTLALAAAVAANKYDSMNEDDLLVSLESTLSSA